MDLTQIRYFATVAETLNFREAARRHDVSQSSVSRQIGDLEEQLGVTLFSRNNRNVSLTEEWASFLPYAMDMQRTAANADNLMSRWVSASDTVGGPSLDVAPVLIRCLDIFFKRYPDVAW
jgi:DNA-binding transcriptional LysR family regulator